MRFSLVTGTMGRTEVLARLLDSLKAQTHRDFELIIVDQNDDERVQAVLARYRGVLPVKHICSAPGLSRARNAGLKHVTGDVVAFPDDDCWYPSTLLEQVARFFKQHPSVSGLTGRSLDEEGNLTVKRKFRSGFVSWKDVYGCGKGISYCIFLRRSVVEQTGRFDERLGVGAGTPWGSGEETDYLLRALQNGARIYHRTDLHIHHPRKGAGETEAVLRRTRAYGRGIGYVFRKHQIGLAASFYYLCGHAFLGAMWHAANGAWAKVRHRRVFVTSRLQGWFSGEPGSGPEALRSWRRSELPNQGPYLETREE